MPGDLIGLQLAIMNEMQHTVTALTRTRLCVPARQGLVGLHRPRRPRLRHDLVGGAPGEPVDGHLLSLGQRRAVERVAYLILHLYERAEGVGYAGNDALQAPFTGPLRRTRWG